MNDQAAVNFLEIFSAKFAELDSEGKLKSLSEQEASLLASALWQNRFDENPDVFTRVVSDVLQAKVQG